MLHSGKRLAGNERKLVGFLHRLGRPCSLGELRSYAVSTGIGYDSLWQNLLGSPTFKKYGPLSYGVPGLK
jgi:hypothetical protein